MARIFITGSADGLGLMTGQLLADQGHEVVLHARNETRAADARAALPAASAVVTGDVSELAEMLQVADQANAHGRFDAVVHNVALGHREPSRDRRPAVPAAGRDPAGWARLPRAAASRDRRRAVPDVGC